MTTATRPIAEARRRRALELAALAVVGVALWATAFAGVFQYDDFSSILGSGTFGAAPPRLSESLGAIRPLTRLTFWAERRLFGFDPAGYHLSSTLLHLAGTLLVWRLGGRIAQSEPGAASPVAFGAALLFLVQPLATEAVTYLSGRASLLAAFLSLLAVERWLAWRERRERNQGSKVAWGSLAAFAFALLAKETAAVVPLALVLVDVATAGRGQSRGPAALVRPYLPHLFVLAAFFAGAASAPIYRRLLAHSLALRGPLENLAVQPRVTLEALALFFTPWRLNLDHDLRAEQIGGDGSWPLAALALGVLALGSCVTLRRRSVVGFGLAWFLVHLAPTCSLVARNDLLSERNLYLPSFGLCLAAVALAADACRALARRLPGRRAPALAAAICALTLVAVLSAFTVRRNRLYADPVALWRDTVAKSPAKARPHANLGWSLERAGDLESAIEEYRVAVRLEPGMASTRELLVRSWERKLRAATVPKRVEHFSAPGSPPAD